MISSARASMRRENTGKLGPKLSAYESSIKGPAEFPSLKNTDPNIVISFAKQEWTRIVSERNRSVRWTPTPLNSYAGALGSMLPTRGAVWSFSAWSVWFDNSSVNISMCNSSEMVVRLGHVAFVPVSVLCVCVHVCVCLWIQNDLS